MKKILESNYWCISVFILIVFAFSLMWGIQQYQFFRFKQQLSATYNYLQDVVDKMMNDENISSFKESEWYKVFADNKLKKISAKDAINETLRLSGIYFDADALFTGDLLDIYIRKPNVKLQSAYWSSTDDIVFKVDLNSSDAPNIELMDKYVFRVSDDGTLIPCDQAIATRIIKSLMYLPEQRKQNGNK